jgi:hypothetical protein
MSGNPEHEDENSRKRRRWSRRRQEPSKFIIPIMKYVDYAESTYYEIR